MRNGNFWSGPQRYETEVVGESHYQQALDKLAGPKTDDGVRVECNASLVLEIGNKHDANAIRVDISKKTVGYLSRDDASDVRTELMDMGIKPGQSVVVKAVIAGGHTGENYGVWLDLPEPPDKPKPHKAKKTPKASTLPAETTKPRSKPWWKFW